MGLFSKKVSDADMERDISEIGNYGRMDAGLKTHIGKLLKNLGLFDTETRERYKGRIRETLDLAGHKSELYLKD